MKKIILFWSITIWTSSLWSQNLNAVLYMAQFKVPDQTPYVECYLNIIGESVLFVPDSNQKLTAKIEVLYLFKQNGKIVAFDKSVLISPSIDPNQTQIPNFLSAVRIPISNGIYNFEMHLSDLNDSSNTYKYSNIVSVDMNKTTHFSDFELLSKIVNPSTNPMFTKGDLELVPFPSNYYDAHNDTLNFYAELYQPEKAELCIMQNYLINKLDSSIVQTTFSQRKIQPQLATPILMRIPIADLKTGKYQLVLSLKDKTNTEIARKTLDINRFNPIFDTVPDTLHISTYKIPEIETVDNIEQMKDYIKSLIPILNQRELFKANNVLKSNQMADLKNFFNNYWNTVSQNPESDWKIYKANVDKVNRSYHSSIKKGYETDRGRIYLQYGPPSDINASTHETSSYPYEIWHYFAIENQTNVKFVFYNPDIVGDDFVLLHSDAKGELSNAQWQKDLVRRNSETPQNWDDTQGEQQYGNRSNQIYNR